MTDNGHCGEGTMERRERENLARPAPTADLTGEALITHQIATVLYDMDNTARLQEHPEELEDYTRRATEFQRFGRIFQLRVVKDDLAPHPHRSQ